MRDWRGCWFAARLTGVLVCSYLWLLVGVLAFPAGMAVLAGALLMLAARGRQFGLWWRFGARPAAVGDAARVRAALVACPSLRGSRQPARLWVTGRGGGQQLILATPADLVVGEGLLQRLASGRLGGEQFAALASHAAGQAVVHQCRLVAVVHGYCWPWLLVTAGLQAAAGRGRRLPLLAVAWRVRWVVFTVALALAAAEGRWVGFAGVAVIAVASWSTGWTASRWRVRLQQLGDDQVLADGLGPALAGLLARPGLSAAGRARLDAMSGERR